MAPHRSRNAVLERAVADLGGVFELASALWPGISRRTGYDRVYQWLSRGRVPGTALGPLVGIMRTAGLSVTDGDISALGGSVAWPPTTECREADPFVKPDNVGRQAIEPLLAQVEEAARCLRSTLGRGR